MIEQIKFSSLSRILHLTSVAVVDYEMIITNNMMAHDRALTYFSELNQIIFKRCLRLFKDVCNGQWS